MKSGLILGGGERVIVKLKQTQPLSAEPQPLDLDIRYEDDDLLVVNKPVGLVVHPAPGHPDNTLVNALVAHCLTLSNINGSVRPGVLHRLDKDTSGLLVVAKNNETHRHLAAQLADRALKREYLALVWGTPEPLEGSIDAPIGRHVSEGKLMAVDGRASREAVTHYLTIRTYQYTSLLHLRLQTGRTHQIRVHLRHIGHPVVADPQYGGRQKALAGISPTYRHHAGRLLDMLPRQALHAFRLGFTHPRSGEQVTVEAPPPDDMTASLEFVQLYKSGS